MKRCCFISLWVILASTLVFAPSAAAGPLSGAVRVISPEKRLEIRCGPARARNFNKDRHPDLLWKSSVTAQAIVWYVKGPSHSGTAFLKNLAFPWNILDIDGLDRAGSPDISWMNPQTGKIAVPCQPDLVRLHLEVLAARAPPSIALESCHTSNGVFPHIDWAHLVILSFACPFSPGDSPPGTIFHTLYIRASPIPRLWRKNHTSSLKLILLRSASRSV